MDFIFIANTWSAGKDNPTSKHRIALEMVRQGHRVLWIEGSGMRTPSVGSSSDRLRMVRKVAASFGGARREEVVSGQRSVSSVQNGKGGQKLEHGSPNTEYLTLNTSSLWVLSPLFIPLPRYEFIRRLNGLICRAHMRFWGWRLGFHDPVLVNYVPVLAEAMRSHGFGYRLLVTGGSSSGNSTNEQEPITNNRQLAPRVVYHCVDRWDAFAMYDSAMMGEMDKRCCQYADLVIASARDLVERCQRYSVNVHLVSHGVDHDHFSRALKATQRPLDLPSGRIAGFFGLLSEWLDQNLLIEVARRVPDCEIVLIGKEDVDIERLRGIRNVHILGARPFCRLPEYVAHFDVGLIPFEVNELTKAVNPIKLREMLSAGCPVVSTALPEVQGYSGEGVVVAGTVARFVEAVAERIRCPATPAERAAISGGVANETWEAKVGEILGLIAGQEEKRTQLIGEMRDISRGEEFTADLH